MENNKEKRILEIECPECHRRLNMEYYDGLEDANLLCPLCKKTSPFKIFKIAEKTVYTPITPVMGELLVKATSQRYPLKEGEYCIGRAAREKVADIQLEVKDRTMSRIHLRMKVRKVGNIYLHRVMNAENKFPTYVNAVELRENDEFNLRYGDTIKMGSTYIEFVRPEEAQS